jgi:hypothetical protein
MKTIAVNLDVKKIDKTKLYVGKKGTYLDAVVFLKDEADEYGNHGFIVQSVTKEEREKGVKGEILGNVKILGQEQPQQDKAQPQKDDDGLPF